MNSLGTAREALTAMRRYVDSGETRSYGFRKHQLLSLRNAINKYEKEIFAALHKDLSKGPEEAYATETGLVLMEIRVALKNLRKWTKPVAAGTNLLNLPSSSKIIYDPLGVVLIIAPWNYPIQLMLLPLVGAIAGGNAVMLKPSELAPACADVLEKMIEETFSSQHISIVCGEGAATILPMMRAFRFDHVFYTGSNAVGKIIYQEAAGQLIPVTLELGGKNPAVIEEDADITVAAKRIAFGKFLNAGQTCVAPDYLIVHSSIKDRFLEKLKESLKAFFGENASESSSYGRIINERRFDKLISYLSHGKIIFGGQSDREKLFIAPTIMEDLSPDSPVMAEEIFGPVLPVFSFNTMDEALHLIEANADPLAFYIFTQNAGVEKKWLEKVRFGGGCVNNTLWQLSNHELPFGGIGSSGIGSYHGRFSFYRFTHAKPVMKTPVWFDPSIKYPPFAGKLRWFKKLIR